jgi:hypothetical protein
MGIPACSLVEPCRLFRCDERKDEGGDGGRFKSVVRGCAGKRLTHKGSSGKLRE